MKADRNSSERRMARVIRRGARLVDVPVLIGDCEPVVEQGEKVSARMVSREDGTSAIEVLCSCGKKIVIECEYD